MTVASSSWRRWWRRNCDNIVVRRRPKKCYRIFLTVCFFVILYANYWKSIVQTSNKIIFDNNFDSDSHRDSLTVKVKQSKELLSQQKKHSTDKTTYHQQENNTVKFYMLDTPDIATILNLQQRVDGGKNNHTNRTVEAVSVASEYYRNNINEESAEMWLHRGFKQLLEANRTYNSKEADVYIVGGYFHLYSSGKIMTHPNKSSRKGKKRKKKKDIDDDDDGSNRTEFFSSISTSWDVMVSTLYRNIVIDSTKPHLILIPTWNPTVSRRIGLYSLVKTLRSSGVSDSNIWSLGFERNLHWQPISHISHIIPIPYVVTSTKSTQQQQQLQLQRLQKPQQLPSLLSSTDSSTTNTTRKKNFVFYVGDYRRNAGKWAGCIPIQIGSRLRGLCDPPCHEGYGWTISGPKYPHLPYGDIIPYDFFPEIDEKALLLMNDNNNNNNNTNDGAGDSRSSYDVDGDVIGSSKPSDLETLFGIYDDNKKKQLRSIMEKVHSGFIYGYGDPVSSEEFGDAASYIWESFVVALKNEREQ
ncbi:hypothetical protein FRACYDRAFT_259805 [Fragilariopsis cylindrus CCMP1102]|uniref:Uncharacterized protein n=1 Tax=Fragilariopsis cylindrus CCMP1102 TaxID=635003 RepID=A0A1E7FSN0_9STRA|nr:hypothetical protein FRACYDRAFT_259805 [Fragilariopsis cylindrus CCMP1102]|eukprot:OEU21114.1 hypothetical protein FRACYDRAFT_259805 [Fragilariopsis cylindrus CCMP1102]